MAGVNPSQHTHVHMICCMLFIYFPTTMTVGKAAQ